MIHPSIPSLKYRKKPIEIEAVQYAGELNYKYVCQFVGQELVMEYKDTDQTLLLPTLEGEMTVQKGDFIIKGIAGEFYSCKEDIFYRTYEPV